LMPINEITIGVGKERNVVTETDCYVNLWLPTASIEKYQTKTIKNCRDPVWNEIFYFRIQSQVKNVLELTICDEDVVRDDDCHLVLFDIAKVPLGKSILMTFKLNPEPDSPSNFFHIIFLLYNVCLCYSQEDLDVRLGFDLPLEEKAFMQKRKKVVAAALKRVLNLEDDLQDDEVPVVAIMTTGGGTRALTAMYVHLLCFQQLDVLDCFSYVTGLSGTTWTMSNLYEDPNWSKKDLEVQLNDAQRHVMKNKFLNCFARERLTYYLKELYQRHQEGHRISFTDLWGLIIEAMLHDGENKHKLSDQQWAINEGQNPLPIYLSINVKNNVTDHDFREWLEFTPYEVGLLKYGAFIRAEDFGSEFFMSRLMKKIPESRICFLEGIWSSVFSLNLMDAWFLAVDSEEFWHNWTRDKITDIEEETVQATRLNKINTRVVSPPDSLSSVFRDVMMFRPSGSEIHNFLKGFQMHNKYLENNFSTWKDCELDDFPNQLTGAEDRLNLVDTAFVFQSSYPPLLRPERKVDVILHLNYSSGSQIKPLKEASEYFSKQGIPFPQIIPIEEEEETVKECYILGEKEGPETPLVLFFPLVNDTFREYKAPGVKRSPEEMAEGDVDVVSTWGPYNVYTLQYSEEDFDKLSKMCYYNIMNNRDSIIQTLRIAVEQKKQHKNNHHKHPS
uniref:Phospholipase A2 n=1 Tax=Sphenodon punctatus TaxID=8508 RepID=A0A8D0GIJ3_SPHPU